MSMLGHVSLALVATSCLFMPGCASPQICTFIGGSDGLYVRVGVTGGMLAPGTYTIFAQVDDVELTADEMILANGTATKGLAEAVVGDKHLILDGLLFGTSGTIVVSFREGRGPAKVTLEVRRDAALIGQGTYEPRYQEFRPNGDGCEPTLEQAHGDLAIVAP